MKTKVDLLPGPPGLPAALGWGWIGAPMWWLTQFEVRYAILPWACRHGESWLVPSFGGAAFGVALLLAWRAWRARQRATSEPLSVFLHDGGIWSAVSFALLVLVQLLPDCFVDPCRL